MEYGSPGWQVFARKVGGEDGAVTGRAVGIPGFELLGEWDGGRNCAFVEIFILGVEIWVVCAVCEPIEGRGWERLAWLRRLVPVWQALTGPVRPDPGRVFAHGSGR